MASSSTQGNVNAGMAGHNVSAVREAVVCLALFGIVLQLISIVGTEWAVPPAAGTGGGSDTFEGVGLWRYCYRQKESPGSEQFQYVCKELVGGSDIPGWVSGVQALSLLAIFFYALAFLAIISFTCCASRRHDKRLLIGFIIMETLAGIFNLTGVVLFSEKVGPTFETDLGLLQLAWCFIINCVSDALAVVTVILAAVEYAKSKNNLPMERFINEMDSQPSATTATTATTPHGAANTTTDPTSGNNMNQGYQNSTEISAQVTPTAQLRFDTSDSNA